MNTQDLFKKRRDKFFKSIDGGVAIIPSNLELIRNHDVHYKFRQDSNFFYLTGFDEPDSVAVLRNIGGKKEYILFVRPRDKEKEIWNGYRAGTEGAKNAFGADRAYKISELETLGNELFSGASHIYFPLLGRMNPLFQRMLESYRESQGRSGKGFLPVHDILEILGEHRIRKSSEEIDFLRKAGQISARAHTEAMARCRPGLNEYQIEALIEYVFCNSGCKRPGYNSIVASGSNSTILHYVDNHNILRNDDLLLIDAGGEYNYYTADITRTFPINGKMTAEQKEIYNIVLDVQLQCIALAKPGVTLTAIHSLAVEKLTEALIKLKLLTGKKEDLIRGQAYKRFYPHGTGHLLGMDVHDIGLYQVDGEPRKLESGMVFTVEPGLYIQPDDTGAPEKFRGIGVRIEDDILITDSGHEVLTADVVKSVEDMAHIIGSKPWVEI